MRESQPFLRVHEVAKALGVVPSRVYQLIGDGELPSVRVGGAIRIPRAAWDEWLRKTSEEALRSLRRGK